MNSHQTENPTYSLGHNGWLKYGWGPEMRVGSPKPSDHLYCDVTAAKYARLMSPLDAAQYTIEQIVATCPPPYYVFASGGEDSQATAYAWLKSGVPFHIVHARYVSNGVWFNVNDGRPLAEFGKKHNVEIKYLNLDLIDFLENHHEEFAKKFGCISPHYGVHAHFAELTGEGTMIYSGGLTTSTLQLELNYSLLSLQRYAEYVSELKINRHIIPFFLTHTPEICLAFGNSVPSSEPGRKRYADNGFDIIQPEKKLTGFEEVKEYYDSHSARVNLETKIRYMSMPSRRNFDLLFRYPLFTINKINKDNLTTRFIHGEI